MQQLWLAASSYEQKINNGIVGQSLLGLQPTNGSSRYELDNFQVDIHDKY